MWIASKSDRLRGLTKNLSEFAREVVTQEAFGWVPVSGAIIFLECRMSLQGRAHFQKKERLLVLTFFILSEF